MRSPKYEMSQRRRPARSGDASPGEVAQRVQVLVFTCDPERYRGLAGANFVDLEAIIRGAGP